MEQDVMEARTCVGARVRRTSRALTSFYNEKVKAAGIRITQWPILAALRAAGAMTITELAQAVGTDQSTISRNIRPLVRDGLVDLSEETDGRKRHLRLTPRGVAKFNEAYPLWKAAQEEVLALVGRDWERVRKMLAELEDAFG